MPDDLKGLVQVPEDGRVSPPSASRAERLETMTITMVEYADGSTGDVQVKGPRDNGIAFKMLGLAQVAIVRRTLQDANALRGLVP